jgi:drug/metabolite transporter (DMT)-like permease
MGVVGVTLMFWPELSGSDWGGGQLAGIGLGMGSVYFASLGNMAATVNTGRQLPVMAVNAWGMLLGGSLSLALAAVLGESFEISWDPAYTWSFLYLSVFGSAVAFTCYLMLIERIGSARAAYSSVLLPVVAMLISTVFEDFRWSAMALIGVAIALIGNAMALTGKRRRVSDGA